MMKTTLWLAFLLVMFTLAACTPGPNEMVKVRTPMGRWQGSGLGSGMGFHHSVHIHRLAV